MGNKSSVNSNVEHMVNYNQAEISLSFLREAPKAISQKMLS